MVLVHKTLTDTLEAYMVKTGFKGEYRLAPLKGKLYAIDQQKIEYKEPEEQNILYMVNTRENSLLIEKIAYNY